MNDRTPPPPLSLALLYLRAARGWTQRQLAAAAATQGRVISDYETGRRRTLGRGTFDELVTLMGFAPEEVDLTLLFVAGLLGTPTQEGPPTSDDPPLAEESRIRRAAAHAALLEAGRIAARLRHVARLQRDDAARREAAALWEELRACSPDRWRQLAAGQARFWTWAMVERLCKESQVAASDEPKRAVELGRLALTVAELAPVEARLKGHLQASAQAHLGNALRTSSELAAAEAAFAAAWRLWREAGAAAVRGSFGEWRLLDLEASLRRDMHQFAAALDLIDRALASAPAEKRGRVLLKKSLILEQAGEIEASGTVLAQASALIGDDDEPRVVQAVRFNRVLNLWHLGRHAEAERLMPALRKLLAGPGNKVSFRRFEWLAARLAIAAGHREEARSTLERIRKEFAADENSFDAALVSLEIAVLDLEDGRFAQVRTLAEEMMWILTAGGIYREALAALHLFVKAAQGGNASADLARRLFSFLQRAQHDPSLRFEAES
jgi:transcriptional regulator with XRE-family HTH domain